MSNPSTILAARVETLSEVPKRDWSLYQIDDAGGYKLTYVGEALARYRRHAAENHGDVPPPGKVVRYDRHDWNRLIAVAEPAARAYFLRYAASGIIKIAR